MAVEVVSDKLCIGCNLCVRVCPVDVFRLQGPEKGKKAYIAYQEDCQSCFICEEYCPTDAIYVAPENPRPIPLPY